MNVAGNVVYVVVEFGPNGRGRTVGVSATRDGGVKMMEEEVGKRLKICSFGILTDPDDHENTMIGLVKPFVVR